MPKRMNPERKAYIEQLFKDNPQIKTKTVFEKVKAKFNGVNTSYRDIQKIRDSLKPKSQEISSEVRDSIIFFLDFYLEAMDITQFSRLVEKQKEKVNNAYSVLEGFING